jgi:hypothetical protein
MGLYTATNLNCGIAPSLPIPVYHGFRGTRDYPKSPLYYNETALATLFVGETPPITRAMAPIAS